MAAGRRSARRRMGPAAWSQAHWAMVAALFCLAALLIVVRTAALAT